MWKAVLSNHWILDSYTEQSNRTVEGIGSRGLRSQSSWCSSEQIRLQAQLRSRSQDSFRLLKCWGSCARFRCPRRRNCCIFHLRTSNHPKRTFLRGLLCEQDCSCTDDFQAACAPSKNTAHNSCTWSNTHRHLRDAWNRSSISSQWERLAALQTLHHKCDRS